VLLTCRPVSATGPDLDRDGDVDAEDFDLFAGCARGPSVPHEGRPLCAEADFDGDGDCDQADFAVFQRRIGRSGFPDASNWAD
jgi:hypothetical protein